MSTNTTPAPRREDMPDGSVRVHFSAPIMHFTEPKGFVTLRQPRVSEMWDHGDPIEYIIQDGAGTPYIDRKVLTRWIGLLMTDHDIDMIGREGSPALAILIEDVVLGFFTSARTQLMVSSATSQNAA